MDEVIAQDMILIDAAIGSGGGAVSSVFGRAGAVVAVAGDYTVGQITGAAPTASPTFTGTPVAPTAAPGTNTTQLATTAFVTAAVAAGGGVTSVSGTANQIGSTGGTTPVLSLSSTLALPGTLSSATNGALSQAAITITGTPVTGGSGTTTFPLVYLNSGTAPTTFSTAGTVLGANAPNGFTGNLLHLFTNGASKFFVDFTGSLQSANNLTIAAGSGYFFSGRSKLSSASDGVLMVSNNAATDFTRLQFGGTTSSFPSLKRTTTALNVRLADDSADASITAVTAAPGTNTTQLATTEFVTAAITAGTSASSLSSSVGAQAVNTVWAGPASGSSANPTFRSLVAADAPVLNVADQGYFYSTGILQVPYASATAVAVVAAGQEVRAFQFVLPVAMTIGRVTVRNGAVVVGATLTVGIYSANGNTKLIDSGTFDCGVNANPKTNTFTAVTLPPGVYYFAHSASTQTTLTANCLNNTNTLVLDMVNNQTTKKWGIAANAAVAGVLPSSLGAITASNAIFPMAACFER